MDKRERLEARLTEALNRGEISEEEAREQMREFDREEYEHSFGRY